MSAQGKSRDAKATARELWQRARRPRGKPLDIGSVRSILKHVSYKDAQACLHVQKTARVRLPNGRRVYATQLYWEHALGLRARKIDAHMRRTCAEAPGAVCMNPAHIVLARANEPLADFMARMEPAGKKKAAVTEETLWQNRADATEELVIAEEDLPQDMEDELPEWRVMDYFSLVPDVHFHARALGQAITG